MNEKIIMGAMLALAASGLIATADIHVNMDFVNIGNAGNSADTTGYGAVGYNYRIGTTEVSVEQFQAAVGAGTGNEGYWSSAGTNRPAVNVSFVEAAKFCNYMTSGNVNTGAYTISGGQVTGVTGHNSTEMNSLVGTYGQVYVLPTENEWYKAAYFKNGSYYDYANGTSTIPVQGVDANYNSTFAWTVNSGAVEQNGTTGMMGNVWEWTESAFDGSLGLPVAENIAFRGGAYNQDGSFLISSKRAQDVYTLEHVSVGMRVVAIPEPGTISLMSLSTVGLFLTRTMRRRKRLGQTLLPVRREHLCDTFCSEQEWRDELAQVDAGEDGLRILFSLVKEGCIKLWTAGRDTYKEYDKVFWNHMVVAHERKLERRMARRQSFRKKALDCFDAFLSLIMK